MEAQAVAVLLYEYGWGNPHYNCTRAMLYAYWLAEGAFNRLLCDCTLELCSYEPIYLPVEVRGLHGVLFEKRAIMTVTPRRHWSLAFLLGIVLALLAGACGGGDSPTGSKSKSPGQAMVLIHDASIDSLKELWLTVASVRLIGGDADSTDESILTEPLRIDFLALDSVARLLTLAEVEGQTFSKIRLEVSNPQFLDVHDNVIDGSQIQLVANGKVDLNFQGTMTIPPGEVAIISVDLDVANAVQVSQTGNEKYILNPQFKLDAGVASGAKVEIHDAVVLSVDATPAGGILGVGTPGSSVSMTILVNALAEIRDGSGFLIQLADLAPDLVVEIEGYIDVQSGEIVATEIRLHA